MIQLTTILLIYSIEAIHLPIAPVKVPVACVDLGQNIKTTKFLISAAVWARRGWTVQTWWLNSGLNSLKKKMDMMDRQTEEWMAW